MGITVFTVLLYTGLIIGWNLYTPAKTLLSRLRVLTIVPKERRGRQTKY